MAQLGNFIGAAVALAAVSTFVGCSLPPVTTSEQQFAIKYNMFVPSAANGLPVPLVPAFADQKPPATTFPVPKEAKSVKLSTVNMNLKMQNTGPLPLKIKIYLSRADVDPYTQAPLGGETGEIELLPNSPEVSKVYPIDTALLSQENLKLGYSFSSAGSDKAITFKDADQVNVKYSVSAAVKLLEQQAADTVERIVFLDYCTVQATFRPPAFPHEWRQFETTTHEELAGRLSEATMVVTNKVPLRADMLARLPRLKLIAVAATGVDIIDLEACQSQGIAVANVRGYARHTVPEHVFMLMLSLRRNLLAFREDLEAGAWQRAPGFCLFTRPIGDLHGATLGLVGYGSLAQGVQRLAEAFGMRVLVSERRGAAEVRPGRTAFDQVLANSDVLSLHCPLTPETRGLIGAAELAAMKPGALLINTARGALIEPEALLTALRSGHLGGAGIDVLPDEPPRAGHPLLDARMPHLIVTPHVAWASAQAMQALADQVVDNLEAFHRGTPQNLVPS